MQTTRGADDTGQVQGLLGETPASTGGRCSLGEPSFLREAPACATEAGGGSAGSPHAHKPCDNAHTNKSLLAHAENIQKKVLVLYSKGSPAR